MRFLERFREHAAPYEGELHALHQAAERGEPLPDASPEARAAFDADGELISRFADQATSATPSESASARDALLAKVSEQRDAFVPNSGAGLVGRLLRKRSLAVVGGAVLVAAVVATAGASGAANHVTDGINDVLETLHVRDQDTNGRGDEGRQDENGQELAGQTPTDATAVTTGVDETPEPTGDIDPEEVGPPGTVVICHSPPGNPDNAQTLSIAASALETHLAHGDSPGACDGDEPVPDDVDGEDTGPPGSLLICHRPPGNPNNAQTISIPESALDAHLAHGDTTGPCGNTEPTDTPEPDEVEPTDEAPTQPQAQIVICHHPPGNPNNARTITIAEPALDAHLGHGDTLGPCPDDTPTPPPTAVPPTDEPTETPTDEPTAAPQAQIVICHHPPGNPGNASTITVPESAVDTHLAHGDTLGPCPTDTPAPQPTAAQPTEEPTAAPTQAQQQITICHHAPGNPNNTRTITIPESALDAHLAHGDTIGACPGDA